MYFSSLPCTVIVASTNGVIVLKIEGKHGWKMLTQVKGNPSLQAGNFLICFNPEARYLFRIAKPSFIFFFFSGWEGAVCVLGIIKFASAFVVVILQKLLNDHSLEKKN